jgi:hypothetical protein
MKRRPWRTSVLVVALSLLALAPAVAPGMTGADRADAARTFGGTPLDDVLFWADHFKQCGLSRDHLAALMIPVTYPETGAPWDQAPSPMTLSRWDNQTGLYAFSNPGQYTDAFWHPGIGMYAFDDAGAWGMTAASRISTWTSSAKTAETMARRWCANPSNSYVWSPWHGCRTGRCQAIFDLILQNGQLVPINKDLNVGRDGGMETRTCVLDGIHTITCWFVDPARAQGYRGFVNPVFGPSPISDPFYVYERDGREYRTWMKEDTGYHTDLTASKPLAANGRTSLSWGFTRNLCDHWNLKGPCGHFRDVAPNATFFDEIEWMRAVGFTSGFPDGTFRPLDDVTRQAMAAFLFRASGSPSGPFSGPTFTDVQAGQAFAQEIAWMTSTGTARGYPDGTFRPLEPVTRQAMAAFLYRLAGAPPGPFPNPGFTDVAPTHPFATEIWWMANEGITTGFGDGSFGAARDVSRQAMAAFLERIYR